MDHSQAILFYLIWFDIALLAHVGPIMERLWKNWVGPRFRELPPLAGRTPSTASSRELDDLRWEEMEPEEDPQPARFRRWDDEHSGGR
jgi:hypothetical protein